MGHPDSARVYHAQITHQRAACTFTGTNAWNRNTNNSFHICGEGWHGYLPNVQSQQRVWYQLNYISLPIITGYHEGLDPWNVRWDIVCNCICVLYNKCSYGDYYIGKEYNAVNRVASQWYTGVGARSWGEGACPGVPDPAFWAHDV